MSGGAAISVRLDEETKKALEKQAKLQERSTSYIARRAIEEHLLWEKNKEEAIEEALKEAEKGEFISSKSMNTWMQSWGTGNELPEPQPDIFLKK